MAALRKTSSFLRDLDEIAFYIASDNPDAALSFIESVETTCQRISNYPLSGSTFSTCKHPDLRRTSVTGSRAYQIFYKIVGGDVVILRLIHGARDLESTLDQ